MRIKIIILALTVLVLASCEPLPDRQVDRVPVASQTQEHIREFAQEINEMYAFVEDEENSQDERMKMMDKVLSEILSLDRKISSIDDLESFVELTNSFDISTMTLDTEYRAVALYLYYPFSVSGKASGHYCIVVLENEGLRLTTLDTEGLCDYYECEEYQNEHGSFLVFHGARRGPTPSTHQLSFWKINQDSFIPINIQTAIGETLPKENAGLRIESKENVLAFHQDARHLYELKSDGAMVLMTDDEEHVVLSLRFEFSDSSVSMIEEPR